MSVGSNEDSLNHCLHNNAYYSCSCSYKSICLWPFIWLSKGIRYRGIRSYSFCNFNINEIVHLYNSVGWSAANKPNLLLSGLKNSHSLVTARNEEKLIGLANVLSDGHLVAYYSHMLVLPQYQRQGIGKKMMELLQSMYKGFHQQILVADGDAINFYKSLGFEQASTTQSMWIYSGNEH